MVVVTALSFIRYFDAVTGLAYSHKNPCLIFVAGCKYFHQVVRDVHVKRLHFVGDKSHSGGLPRNR